jgi:8-oxo-dGTP pyrophosphatase MutT (NUDIX family)
MTVPSYEWDHDGRTTTFSWVGNAPDVVPARVYALAFTDKGRILLVGAGAEDDATWWWLPGGGVEQGESAEQALVRELQEEAGAVMHDLEFLGYRSVDDPVEGLSHIAMYWCQVTVPDAFVPRCEVTKNLFVLPEQFLAHLYWAEDPAAAHLLELATETARRRSTVRATPLTDARRQRVLELVAALGPRRPLVVAEEALGSQWAPVTRLRLDQAVPGSGRSVVVKTTRRDAGDWGLIENLRRERAALGLLAGSGVAPALLAADDGLELVVMTDHGGTSLEALLLGDDADAATGAVVALGDTLGGLHAWTLGREDEHLRALAASGSPRPHRERYGTWAGVDGWDDIEEAAVNLGLPDPRSARYDVERVRERLLDPGPFLALTHTDPSPCNAVMTATGVVLVDWEGSGFRHVGLDAAWLHFPFPNYSAHYAVLPGHVVRSADAAYRARLAAALPEARSDPGYEEMLAVGLAAALVVRSQRLPVLAAPDQAPYDSWRRRTQLVQQIEVFLNHCTATGLFPALGAWFAELSDAMTRRWPDANTPPPPVFPAFEIS